MIIFNKKNNNFTLNNNIIFFSFYLHFIPFTIYCLYKIVAKEGILLEKKKKHIVLKIFLALIITVLIVALSGIITVYFIINQKVDKIDYVSIPKSQVYIDEKVNSNLADYRNIALFGIDARSDTFSAGNRSDCIMIISINEKTKDVKIASVYRDTYLDINNRGLDKVNHAYSFGGPALAMSTLNKNLDLNISEFVAINFDTVKTAVDCVGGVTVALDSEEAKYINGYIDGLNDQFGTSSPHITKAGTYNLDGTQALAYARIRYTDGGDYKRTERMRDVLLLVFNKAKSMGIGELNELADTILPHISTNITKKDIIAIIPKVPSYKVDKNFGWPYEVKGYTGAAWYGVPVDLKTNVTNLHKELFGEENYEPSNTVVEISNRIVEKTGYLKE